MSEKKYWSYLSGTGELAGEGFADISPLDEEEVWLFPQNSTEVAPPQFISGSARVWDNNAWNQVLDYRGQTWWLQGEPFEVVELGLPVGGKQFGPPATGLNQIAIWDGVLDDWVIHPDFRNETWWQADQTAVIITELGNPADLGLVPIRPADPEPEPFVPPPPPPPLETSLTKRQIVRAMIIGGGIQDPDTHILTALDAITDTTERALAREDWKYSPYFIRNHSMFSNAAVLTAANFTPAMVDDLWILGSTQPL